MWMWERDTRSFKGGHEETRQQKRTTARLLLRYARNALVIRSPLPSYLAFPLPTSPSHSPGTSTNNKHKGNLRTSAGNLWGLLLRSSALNWGPDAQNHCCVFRGTVLPIGGVYCTHPLNCAGVSEVPTGATGANCAVEAGYAWMLGRLAPQLQGDSANLLELAGYWPTRVWVMGPGSTTSNASGCRNEIG